MGNAAQEPLAAAPHEHDAVLLGELVERGLHGGDVAARLGVEALEQRGLRLVEVLELFLLQPVATRGVGDQLVVHVLVAEALGHLLTDLGTAGSHLVGNGHDGHGIHSFRYLAFSAAGAMAMRLPPTSSRT